MRFCVFLTRRGFISATQCVQVLGQVCDGTPPLGKLAVRERVLSIAQVADLLRSRDDATPLGRLAIDAGYLSEADRCMLLERQKQLTPRVEDVLVEMGFLTPEVVAEQHAAFLASM